MRNLLLLIACLGSILFTSCSNEIDINAPYKEEIVVFGLLNKTEDTHYIRISKSYQGEGNALDYASMFDSIYYNPELLTVTIEEVLVSNGQTSRTFELSPNTDIPKDPGIFSNPSQIIYSFETTPSAPLRTDATYKLKVRNNSTEVECTGETDMVGNIILSNPSANLPSIPLYPRTSTTMKIKSAENGKLYELFIYFKYREYNEQVPGSMVSKSIEISLGRTSLDNTAGGKEFSNTVSNQVIYQTLANSISPATSTNPMVRLADSLTFVVNVASEALETYLSVNQPSNTLAQERPVFNNVENGIGLFSSRTSFKRSYYINDASVDSLKNNPITQDLNWLPR